MVEFIEPNKDNPQANSPKLSSIKLIHGDCIVEMVQQFNPGVVDCICTDPPYGLEFMGKEWDKLGAGIETCDEGTDKSHPFRDGSTRARYGKFFAKRDPSQDLTGKSSSPFLAARVNQYVAGKEMQDWHQKWAESALYCLKPGGYALVFGGTRTYHRLTCGLEDAGFEIRDCLIFWSYLSGFPKSKALLKPSYEPIVVCRKPGGDTKPLNIDECRVGEDHITTHGGNKSTIGNIYGGGKGIPQIKAGLNPHNGRWPANQIHDGSPEVLEFLGDSARYFYCAKASREERELNCHLLKEQGRRWNDGRKQEDKDYPSHRGASDRGNLHPTVKPLELMKYLVKLVTPTKKETVLDPFMGSGTTGLACSQLNINFVGIEKDEDSYKTARYRILGDRPLPAVPPPRD
jgi:DNA modification methylase